MDATARELINHYLSRLGPDDGAPFTLDEAGNCLIEDDAGIECVLSVIESGFHFLLSSTLDQPGSGEDPGVMQLALTLNGQLDLTGGASISYQPDRQILVVHRTHGVSGLSHENFEAIVTDFFDTVADIEAALDEETLATAIQAVPESRTMPESIRV